MAKKKKRIADTYGARNNPMAHSPFEIVLYPTDRSAKDTGKWKQAIQQAESIDFPNRTLYLDMANEAMLDPILSSCIDKRRMAITDSPLKFGNDGKEYPEINDLIELPWFEDMITDILDCKFFGPALMWFDPSDKTKVEYAMLPRKHILPEAKEYRRYQHDLKGKAYNVPPLNKYSFDVGNSHSLGLLVKAIPFVLLKRGNFSDWANFAEIFGQPLRKGKYPSRDNEAKQTIKQALIEAGSSPFIVIPDELDVEFEQATANSDGKLYNTLGEACDNQVIFLTLGQLLTTKTGDKGARALGEVHLEVEKRINRADKKYVLNALNHRFKKLLKIHGYNVGDGRFSFAEENTMPIADQLKMDLDLNEIVELPPEFFYEKYNLPLPKGGAKLKVQPGNSLAQQKQNLGEPDFFD